MFVAEQPLSEGSGSGMRGAEGAGRRGKQVGGPELGTANLSPPASHVLVVLQLAELRLKALHC